MSTARTFTLLALAILGTMASATGSTSAQETEVEVRAEPGGGTCAPCTVHITGEWHIVALPSGMEITTCDDEYVARLYTGGTGEVEWVGRAHGGWGCAMTNCTTMSPHWAVTRIGETGGETEHLTIGLCYRAGATELECNMELRSTRTATTHQQAYTATQLCAGGARRVELVAASEGRSVELVHHS